MCADGTRDPNLPGFLAPAVEHSLEHAQTSSKDRPQLCSGGAGVRVSCAMDIRRSHPSDPSLYPLPRAQAKASCDGRAVVGALEQSRYSTSDTAVIDLADLELEAV